MGGEVGGLRGRSTERPPILLKKFERIGFQKGLDAANRGDFATALREWRPLAEQGDASAQNNLGFMYVYGKGVLQDYVRAHMWFNIAASSGGSKNSSKSRDNVAKKMTPSQVEKAQKLARECVRKRYKDC